jgi:hypothetical protein
VSQSTERDPPSRRRQRLQPYLRLANLVQSGCASPAELMRKLESTALVREPEFELCHLAWTDELIADGFWNLAVMAQQIFSGLAQRALSYGKSVNTAVASIVRDKNRVRAQLLDPAKDFLDALDGAEAARIKRCVVCRNFFYALRSGKTGTKACSRRCNHVERTRRWRAEQALYEHHRKCKSAGVKPEGSKRK